MGYIITLHIEEDKTYQPDIRDIDEKIYDALKNEGVSLIGSLETTEYKTPNSGSKRAHKKTTINFKKAYKKHLRGLLDTEKYIEYW